MAPGSFSDWVDTIVAWVSEQATQIRMAQRKLSPWTPHGLRWEPRPLPEVLIALGVNMGHEYPSTYEAHVEKHA